MRINTLFISLVVCCVFMHLEVLYTCDENEPLWIPVARKLIENPDLEKNLKSSDPCLREFSEHYQSKKDDDNQFYFFTSPSDFIFNIQNYKDTYEEKHGVKHAFIKCDESFEMNNFIGDGDNTFYSIQNMLLIIDFQRVYSTTIHYNNRDLTIKQKKVLDGRIFVIQNKVIMPLIKHFVYGNYDGSISFKLYKYCFSSTHYNYDIIVSNILQDFCTNAADFLDAKLRRCCDFYAYVLKNQLCSQKDTQQFMTFLKNIVDEQHIKKSGKHIAIQTYSAIFHFFLSHFFINSPPWNSVNSLPLDNETLNPYVEILQTVYDNHDKVTLRNFQDWGCFDFPYFYGTPGESFLIWPSFTHEQKLHIDALLSFINNNPQLYSFFNEVYEENKDGIHRNDFVSHVMRRVRQMTQPRLCAKCIDYVLSERYKKYVRPYYKWINKTIACGILWLLYWHRTKCISCVPLSWKSTWNYYIEQCKAYIHNLAESVNDATIISILKDDFMKKYKVMIEKKIIDLGRESRIQIREILEKNPEWDFETIQQYLDEILKNKKK